ncbi:hypothetical protein GJAV_G00002950 [Gymnothorax javanicus]|nr:hypothetical protein GJAV_G00002950 [Gymnothorax javanicus]
MMLMLSHFRGKWKREKDSYFLDALRKMDEANQAVLQQGYEQQDRFMQHLLESQADEMKMRRQELAFLRAEAVETGLLQRDFQTGSLAVLGQLAQSLSQKIPTAPPLDG